jgi:hypothetical protein
MPPIQEFVLTKFHAVPSKAKWSGMAMVGLLGAAFAAYGVVPEGASGVSAQGASKQVTELIAPIQSAALSALPTVGATETGLAPFVDHAAPQDG